MANHFSDIGFPVFKPDEFVELAVAFAQMGKVHHADKGIYVIYEDECGIVLSVQADNAHQLIGLNPHFHGKSVFRVRITNCYEADNTSMDGAVKAWALPQEATDLPGAFPMRFEMPDYRLMMNKLERRPEVYVQLTGFAHQVSCYPDEQAFHDDQPPGAKRAVQSFIPCGLLMLDQDQEEESAEAVFSGWIKSVKMKINPFTGQGFWHMCVSTFGGEVDVVADPELVTGIPQAGGIINGLFWLSGRVLMEIESEQEKNAG